LVLLEILEIEINRYNKREQVRVEPPQQADLTGISSAFLLSALFVLNPFYLKISIEGVTSSLHDHPLRTLRPSLHKYCS